MSSLSSTSKESARRCASLSCIRTKLYNKYWAYWSYPFFSWKVVLFLFRDEPRSRIREDATLITSHDVKQLMQDEVALQLTQKKPSYQPGWDGLPVLKGWVWQSEARKGERWHRTPKFDKPQPNLGRRMCVTCRDAHFLLCPFKLILKHRIIKLNIRKQDSPHLLLQNGGWSSEKPAEARETSAKMARLRSPGFLLKTFTFLKTKADLLIKSSCKDVELCAKHHSKESSTNHDCQALRNGQHLVLFGLLFSIEGWIIPWAFPTASIFLLAQVSISKDQWLPLCLDSPSLESKASASVMQGCVCKSTLWRRIGLLFSSAQPEKRNSRLNI